MELELETLIFELVEHCRSIVTNHPSILLSEKLNKISTTNLHWNFEFNSLSNNIIVLLA